MTIKRLKWRKPISVCLVVMMLLSSTIYSFGLEIGNGPSVIDDKIQVYLKPDVTILINGKEAFFQNEKGEIVYPVIYKGSTYLPVRAISKLMNEEIEWNEYMKTIFIGKTLRNPNKIKRSDSGVNDNNFELLEIVKPKPTMTTAYLRPNFSIMYDFVEKEFFDEKGTRVYPIVIDGSTYLPIRAASEMIDQKIDWNGITKTIRIETDQNEEEAEPAREETKKILEIFEKQLVLYDNATVKIQNIQKAKTNEELLIIANEVSSDYSQAGEYIEELSRFNVDSLNENELIAFGSLAEFSIMSQQYILILENIAYLAAESQDYSMLIETFVDYVINTQKLLDEVRNKMELL